MITSQLKSILLTAGCSLILYESDKLANVLTDLSDQNDIIGLILQSNSMYLDAKGNGTTRRYPITIEVMKQVRPEDLAENNEAVIESLVSVCESIIYGLTVSGSFKKIPTIEMIKINENKYDANLLGWSMSIELIPITNELNC